MLIESNELRKRIRDIAASLQSKGDERVVGLIEVDRVIVELESKGTSLDRKCGSCRWAIPFKTSVSNVKCTNPILESKRKDEIASLKQRTVPACKQYEVTE